MWDLIGKLERLAPQWFIAITAILIAVGFMFYNKPPHKFCNTQANAYIAQQKKFLASKAYDNFFETCLKSNTRGACEPYFSGFKKVMDDFRVVDLKCQKTVADLPRLKSAMTSFLVQVPRLAWGDDGPESIHSRGGWLGPSHFRVFCRIKNQYQRSYGEPSYEALVKNVLEILPEGKRKLSKLQKKDRSLFSAPCSQYF